MNPVKVFIFIRFIFPVLIGTLIMFISCKLIISFFGEITWLVVLALGSLYFLKEKYYKK